MNVQTQILWSSCWKQKYYNHYYCCFNILFHCGWYSFIGICADDSIDWGELCGTVGATGTRCSVWKDHWNEDVSKVLYIIWYIIVIPNSQLSEDVAYKSSVHFFCCRVYGQFILEIIFSTAFGHQAEILRGKAENDELHKAVHIHEYVDYGGAKGFLSTVAIQCKHTQFPFCRYCCEG